jgi:hypothetical protein
MFDSAKETGRWGMVLHYFVREWRDKLVALRKDRSERIKRKNSI